MDHKDLRKAKSKKKHQDCRNHKGAKPPALPRPKSPRFLDRFARFGQAMEFWWIVFSASENQDSDLSSFMTCFLTEKKTVIKVRKVGNVDSKAFRFKFAVEEAGTPNVFKSCSLGHFSDFETFSGCIPGLRGVSLLPSCRFPMLKQGDVWDSAKNIVQVGPVLTCFKTRNAQMVLQHDCFKLKFLFKNGKLSSCTPLGGVFIPSHHWLH